MDGAPLATFDPRPASVYALGGEILSADSPGFPAKLLRAYATRSRPRCMCVAGGVEMYTSRHDDVVSLKRLPGTGSQHAPSCPSYEIPVDASGLGRLLGSAIRRDPWSGDSKLSLGFSLSARHRNLDTTVRQTISETCHRTTQRLSMLGMLHYLWDQAELTHWHPSFRCRRSWAVVRKRVMAAASQMQASRRSLGELLHLPEPFMEERAHAAREQRRKFFATAQAERRLALLVGELKSIYRSRDAWRLAIRHMPELPILLDEGMYRKARARFTHELELWHADDRVRLLAFVAVSVGALGALQATSLSLSCTSSEWIPFSNQAEWSLLTVLLSEQRSFIRSLQYGLAPHADQACVPYAFLTDTAQRSQPLFIDQRSCIDDSGQALSEWTWNWLNEEMPRLPHAMSAREA
jgi:hypothetical protein